jgi:hypothetical protein
MDKTTILHIITNAIVMNAGDSDESFDEGNVGQSRKTVYQLKNKYFGYQIVLIFCRINEKIASSK